MARPHRLPFTPPAPERVRLARLVALAADFLQIMAFPLFFSGAASVPNAMLDFAVASFLVFLLGWHWAFIPTFLAEMVPVLDLFPTWTAAVYFVTRGEAVASNDRSHIPPPEP